MVVGLTPTSGTKEQMIDSINGFFGPYRFLSNFHYTPVNWAGVEYSASENAYQAAKFPPDLRDPFVVCTPREAKQLSRKLVARPDWDEVKLRVMRHLLDQKFAQEPVRTLLLATGDKYLEETNTWGDVFWGVCNGFGLNELGKMIMEIRDNLWLEELRKENEMRT